jgi:ABC-2 type transport system ATP-binding protein
MQVPSIVQNPVLRARGLVRRYGARKAVDGLDLVVRRGECFGLLGPNGAGKSTTLRMCSARLLPDAGELEVLGMDPRTQADEIRARIGLVPQDLAVYGDLSARENLRLFGGLHGLHGVALAAAVEQALESAGLADRADDRVKTYSGGMKRRLNVVAGTLHDPELVLLDEPTVGIDPQSRNRIFDLVSALRAKGTSIVYTSHALGEVERLCDRIAILDAGRLVGAGSLSELQQEHRARVGSVGDLGLRFSAPAQLAAGRIALASAGIACETIEEVPDLEEIFLGLTGRKLRDEES